MSYQPHQSEDLTLKPVAGSVPAQGEAMEDLALLVRLCDRMSDEGSGSFYHPDTLAQRNAVVRRLREWIESASRALVAASPCKTDIPLNAQAYDNCGARIGFGCDCAVDRCSLVAASPCAAQPEARPVTAAEDRWLRNAAKRGAKLVAPGRLAAAQGGQQPDGWAHSEDPDRVISAAQKRQAEKDGGASASSVRAYTNALYAAPAAPEAPLTEAATLRDALERVIATTYSHVDGRDLLAELHPRRMLDIKRRVDGRETWFEGDWLSNLWEAVKGAKRVLAGQPFDLPRPSGPAIGSSMDDSSCEAGITLAGTAQKESEDGR